jgi:hypothetical protein
MGCWQKLKFHSWEKHKIGHQRSQVRTGTPYKPGRPLLIDAPKKIKLVCKKCFKEREFNVVTRDEKLLHSYTVNEKAYKFDSYTAEQKVEWIEQRIARSSDN